MFTQQLTELLRSPYARDREALKLSNLYGFLDEALRDSGYLPPLLCNAEGFRRPLARPLASSHSSPYELLKRRPTALARLLSRYALAVAGESDDGGDDSRRWYDPSIDATTMYRSLLDSHCGFTANSTSLLSTPPSRDELFGYVEAVAQRGENMTLLYFVGHGVARQSNGQLDLYMQLADDETVSVSDLVDGLRSTRAEHVVVFIDACHSDRAGETVRLLSRAEHPFHSERPGFSRLVVEWFNVPQQEPPSYLPVPPVPSPYEVLRDWGGPPEYGVDVGAIAPWRRSVWAFAFQGAVITYHDRSGPLKRWLDLLRGSNDPVQAHRRLRGSFVTDALFDAPGPVPAAQQQATSGETTEPYVPPPSDAGRPVFRRHRPRLRVRQETLPLRVGRHLQVTFDYLPLDEEWTVRPGVDATETSPLEITLRINAATASVRPSVIHTRLTDAAGTPPEQFEVIPEVRGPVRLRIAVVRSADGAVIQQISSVLNVTGEDGADV
ncbi:caspase family protein [Streptomyces sp. NBC_00271]|uniref:caspase family protein n=1 Tax=Streptomyces sp. NBC_00271 TaxID=2975697 RepID=UPI002E2AC527|nr:caspase family protein [Streptomyces sp. NBC_00271]